jgi:hypothetical protein
MGVWLDGQKDCPESLHVTQGIGLGWGPPYTYVLLWERNLSSGWECSSKREFLVSKHVTLDLILGNIHVHTQTHSQHTLIQMHMHTNTIKKETFIQSSPFHVHI